ncbi:Aspartyl protease family protein [Quillaja saponaria]|uniref:Aspartyl protease family protein n=1 Tax=Quillaja saponaria TaxID=32244 RepID=A0AAD7LUM4_QUISA|nr:Aspartyl protease family protein [Quillaja saponaria]
MATQNSSLLFGSVLLVLFFLCSLEDTFGTAQYHNVQLSSLLPSSTCSPSTKGPNKKTSLKVVHKHGPCSQTKQEEPNAPTHIDILLQDQSRVNSIHSRLSSTGGGGDVKKLDSTTLPAKSGSSIGSGNYIVVVGLGTPRNDLSLIFDTGSDLTWTQCEPCARSCYKQKEPILDPSKSTTYSNITCTNSLCSRLSSATGNTPKCAATTSTCIYGIQYGDSSFSIGYVAKETLTLPPNGVVPNYLFGCGQDNQGLFGGAAGLLGLGRNAISFVQQTALKYNKIFSYCLPATASSTGYLSFGGGASNSVKYTSFSDISQGSSFYGIEIVGITVGGNKLSIPSSVFSSSGSIIDSGTVITRLTPGAYGPLRTAFRRAMSKYPAVSGLSILDTCYDLSGYKSFEIPKISFLFGGGVSVDLASSGIVYAVSAKQVCLGFAANEDAGDVTIFGNVQQKTLEIVYDVGGGRVGFGSAGCH